ITPLNPAPKVDDDGADDIMDDDLLDSEPDFDVICNVVSILPREYDV
ncbi:hypothetical protein A2U01_0102576, partial [Trifolium medium]|nr:hypothetical protein [Trifolium medium]